MDDSDDDKSEKDGVGKLDEKEDGVGESCGIGYKGGDRRRTAPGGDLGLCRLPLPCVLDPPNDTSNHMLKSTMGAVARYLLFRLTEAMGDCDRRGAGG